MKKKRIIMLIIILLLIGGYYLKKEFDKKKLIETEGPRIEKYLKYNYKDIESVTFTDVIINPTGVPHIKGYVNNDKESHFDAGIYKDHFSRALDFYGNIPERKKSEEPNKSVEKIENEETSQKNK